MDDIDKHKGEPRNWSTDELLAWLDDDDRWRGVARFKLVEEVCRRLDDMYQTFVPRYPNVDPVIDLQVLMPWAPWVKENQSRALRFPKRTHGLAARDHEPGPLTVAFNASFSAGEFMANFGRSLPMGRHPQDDFRQNQLIMASSVDDGQIGGFVLQDVGQQEAMPIKVVGVWFLPPGGKLYPGYKVACHNLHGHPLQSLNGLTGTVVASAGGKCTVELDSAGDNTEGSATSKKTEKVPNWALLFRKGTNIAEGAAGQPRKEFFESIIAGGSWLKWEPKENDTVVLRGLKARPELNGRFGQIVKLGQASGSDAESVRHSVKLVKTADPSSEESMVSVKRANMVAVEEPPPVLAIAYTVQRKSQMGRPKIERFVHEHLPLLNPLQAIHCTLREIKCWNRCVDADSRLLAPVPKALKKKLLGKLDPAQWRLGVLMPLKRQRQDRDVKKAATEVKAAASCRNCGKQRSSEQKLQWCSRCHGVAYCSVECQRADWKARHRQECAGSTTGGATAAGEAPPGEPGPSGNQSGQADSNANSVLVPIGAQGNLGPILMTNVRSGKGYTAGAQQRNIHGDKRFLVKIQNPVLPGQMTAAMVDPDNERWFQGSLLLYDKAQSIQFHIHPEVSPEAHKKLARMLATIGVCGRLNPAARKVYLRARREAANLRIYLADPPSQQQTW